MVILGKSAAGGRSLVPSPLAAQPSTTIPVPPLFPNASAATSVSPAKRPTVVSLNVDANKPMEMETFNELINKTTIDLSNLMQLFNRQAVEANAYDGVLRRNDEKLLQASVELNTLEQRKEKFRHELSFVGDQLMSLEQSVLELEKKFDLPDWTDGQGKLFNDNTLLTKADMDRQYMLQLLLTADAQLKQAEDDIRDASKESSQLRADRSGTPSVDVATLKRLLEKQIDMLQWLDGAEESLRSKTSFLKGQLQKAQK